MPDGKRRKIPNGTKFVKGFFHATENRIGRIGINVVIYHKDNCNNTLKVTSQKAEKKQQKANRG